MNKLFSIGIYNALIGNDRSMDNLCKLINRPRTKKEAKLYYKIDQATYESAIDNGEVSETEIQNILNHFKKLGKSTDRYTDSFNNIAAQYTDDQLKLIINVLPMKVKAVLEAESDKYQSLMGTSGEHRKQAATEVEPGIRVNTIGSGNGNNMNGPIVIPSGVKRFTGGSKPIIPTNTGSRPQQQKPAAPVSQPVQQARPPVQQQRQPQQINQVQQRPVPRNQVQEQVAQPKVNPVVQEPIMEPQRNERPAQTQETKPNNGQRYTGTIAQVKRTLVARRKVTPASVTPKPIEEEAVENTLEVAQEPKRGRGRPKKIVTEIEEKPKGKRGRPRKIVPEEENDLNDLLGELGTVSRSDEVMMPGLEEETEQEDVLPGLEENMFEEDSGMLPGLDDEDIDENASLPELGDTNAEEIALPGLEDEETEGEEVDVNSLLAGLDDDADTSVSMPGLEDNNDVDNSGVLPGLDDDEDDGMLSGLGGDNASDTNGFLSELDSESDDSGLLPGLDNDDSNEEETILPGMGFEDDEEDPFAINSSIENNNSTSTSNAIESIKPQIDYSMSNLNSLLSKDKKIVAFVGATKNGTSFLINNLALMFSMMGIDTAILDMTQNKNSYYLFTDSREELRKIAYTSLSKLENGYADGIKFNKNLTVYTSLPSDGTVYENAEPILSTLVQNHSLVLIDTDFTTPPAYFASSQEIYLVQSMDILTIQPLTAFLRDLKFKGAWEPEKARVVINKEVPIRILSNKTIIGGMSRYNGPDMSVMTDLFNKDMVKACSIPFDEKVYAKYLETLATCKLSISSLPKQFRAKLQMLGEMVYPRLNSKTSYSPSPDMSSVNYNPQGNAFSSNTNNILNKMKKKF